MEETTLVHQEKVSPIAIVENRLAPQFKTEYYVDMKSDSPTMRVVISFIRRLSTDEVFLDIRQFVSRFNGDVVERAEELGIDSLIRGKHFIASKKGTRVPLDRFAVEMLPRLLKIMSEAYGIRLNGEKG